MRITVTPDMSAEMINSMVASGTDIVFSSGTYCFDRPLIMDGVSNINLTGVGKVSIQGAIRSRVVWEICGKNLYRAPLVFEKRIDGVVLGQHRFYPARYPHYNADERIWNGYAADALDVLLRSAHPEDGFLHVMQAHMWGDFHFTIAGIREDGTAILEGGQQNNRRLGLHHEYMYVENAKELLGADGEFFYDHRESFLYLYSTQQPVSDILLIISPCLVRIHNCSGIGISHLAFENSSRTFMNSYEPLLRSDWCIHRGGAVFVEDSKDVHIDECAFEHIGSNAVFFSGNVACSSVEKSLFNEIGASGICFVGKPSSVYYPCTEVDGMEYAPTDVLSKGPASNEYVHDCSVSQCLIRNIGKTEKQTACVEISMSSRITVSNCTLHTCPRAAINISEGTFGGHTIRNNEIFDTVRETSDHGSINSWGRDRFWHLKGLTCKEAMTLALKDAVGTTVITRNRVRCDHGWDIDLDDGSSNYSISENICLAGGIKLREGFQRTVTRNVMINNTLHPHVWFDMSGDRFEYNIIMRSYKPIRMPLRWGECIDHNILAVPEGAEEESAQQLSAVSGQDTHSICQYVDFNSECFPLSPFADGFFLEKTEYGVTEPKLRSFAAICPIDRPQPIIEKATAKVCSLHGMEFKNIETDGEMSAYATKGHNGVLILRVSPQSVWYRAGLRENTAIVACNGIDVSDSKGFLETINQNEGNSIVLSVRDSKNGIQHISMKLN